MPTPFLFPTKINGQAGRLAGLVDRTTQTIYLPTGTNPAHLEAAQNCAYEALSQHGEWAPKLEMAVRNFQIKATLPAQQLLPPAGRLAFAYIENVEKFDGDKPKLRISVRDVQSNHASVIFQDIAELAVLAFYYAILHEKTPDNWEVFMLLSDNEARSEDQWMILQDQLHLRNYPPTAAPKKIPAIRNTPPDEYLEQIQTYLEADGDLSLHFAPLVVGPKGLSYTTVQITDGDGITFIGGMVLTFHADKITAKILTLQNQLLHPKLVNFNPNGPEARRHNGTRTNEQGKQEDALSRDCIDKWISIHDVLPCL